MKIESKKKELTMSSMQGFVITLQPIDIYYYLFVIVQIVSHVKRKLPNESKVVKI